MVKARSKGAVNPVAQVIVRSALICALFALAPLAGVAQTTPAASPSPAPTPSPTATPGFSLGVTGSNLYVSQSANGPGLQPPEAAQFIAGRPVSPMSPYDWFTSAVQSPGAATQLQYVVTATEHTKLLTASAGIALDAYVGSLNNLLYWGEPMVGTFDPHEGHSNLNYAINFPTGPGQYSVQTIQEVSPYTMSLGSSDGAWKVSGGYINLTQTDRFVFAPPAVTNANPALGEQTAETLGPGMPALASWNASPATLPLLGGDAVVTRGKATLELTDALLPVLQGMGARLTMGSLVIDHGDAGRYSAQLAQIDTSGVPIGTTTYFGTNQTLYPSAQGRLFSSVLDDQYQTLAGVRAFVHPHAGDDVLVELGRGWYTVNTPAEPGTGHFGNYEHLAFARHFDAHTDAGIDYYHFDPRYADVILPYGIPENIWAVAWSWPGQWLKSTYEAVDNTIVGINRAGYRAHADLTRGRFEAHADAYAWRQLEPITLSNASQEGWIDGYFLPQVDANATRGWQRQAGVYTAWHFGNDDLALDAMWDRSYRPALDSVDLVSMNYPQVVASWQHHWGTRTLAVLGYGRYSANGMWSTTPVSGIYGTAFAGVQRDLGGGQQIMLTLRRFGLEGIPSIPGGPAPDVRGTAILLEHRIAF